MNCKNCGAPMTLFRKRAYFYCTHCGAFHFTSASPDGVRLLGDAPQGIKCPICRLPLRLASLDDRFQGYQCQKCQGILLDRFSFRHTVEARRARALGPAEAPQPLDQKELARLINCPTCARAMQTHPYYGPGNIVIDTCQHCNTIWLDYGELAVAVNAPGRDRGASFVPREPAFDKQKKLKKLQGRRRKKEIDLGELLDKLFS
jgi:Zn-finger nucleic acid-binding protein